MSQVETRPMTVYEVVAYGMVGVWLLVWGFVVFTITRRALGG